MVELTFANFGPIDVHCNISWLANALVTTQTVSAVAILFTKGGIFDNTFIDV